MVSSGGVVSHRVRVTRCLRAAGHLGMVLRTRNRRALAVTVGSMAADVWLTRRMRRDDEPHRVAQVMVGSAESAAWGLVSPPTVLPRIVVIATGVPEAIEGGFRAGSGGRSAPPVPGAPHRFEHATRVFAREVATGLVPALVSGVVRRRRGLWPAWGSAGWVLFAFANGAGLGRLRLGHHARQRARWRSLNERSFRASYWSGQVHAARANTVGHSFKKVLLVLGQAGSPEAHQFALDATDHPATVGPATSDGAELLSVCLAAGTWPEPERRRSLWLTNDQANQLRRFLDAARATVDADLDDDVVRVFSVRPDRVVVSHRGREVELHEQVKRPGRGELRLDPVALAFLLGVGWKLSLVLPTLGKVRLRSILPGAAVDLVAAGVAVRRPSSPARQRSLLAAGLASNALSSALVSREPVRRHGPGGELLFPASGMGSSLLFLVARYWERLTPRQRVAWLAWALAQWTAASYRQILDEPFAALLDLTWSAFVPLAVMGLDHRLEAETQVLDHWMEAEAAERMASARHAGVGEELARFRHALEVAERARHQLRDRIEPDLGELVDQECHRLRAWLDDPRTAPWLAS